MKRILCLLLLALPLSAQESNLFPTFAVSAGSYSGEFETDVLVNDRAAGAIGTAINLENDLGLDGSQQVRRFGLQWRPFSRHELAVRHFSAERSGFERIDRNITFREITYPVQAEVTTRFDTELWEATYTYWMRRSAAGGFGIVLGASGISLDALISARSPAGTALIAQDAQTDVPVALVGAQTRFIVGRRMHAELSAAMLPNVELEDYSGRATTAAARLELRVARAINIGAAYHYFRIDGTVTHPDFDGELGMKISGPELFVRVGF